MNQFADGVRAFDDAHYYLRGNDSIEYKQLGLDFVLYSCEALFNRGLCAIYSGKEHAGMLDLRLAATQKQTEEHTVIDEAISENANGFTVFSVPVGIIYRPPANKLRNLGQKDYLGKAKLIAVSSASDTHSGFSGTALQDKSHLSPASDWKPHRKGSLPLQQLVPSSNSPTHRRQESARKLSAPDAFAHNPMVRSKSANSTVSELNFSQPKPRSPMASPSMSRPPRDTNARSFLASAPASVADVSPPLLQEPFHSEVKPQNMSTQSSRKMVQPLDLQRTNATYPPTPPDSREGEDDVTEDLYAAYGDAVQRESAIFGGPSSPLASRFAGVDSDTERISEWARSTAMDKLVSPNNPPSAPLSRNGSVFRRRPDAGEDDTLNMSSASALSTWAEVSKIRVNVSFKGRVSTINVTPATLFGTFLATLQKKLGLQNPAMSFKDEDGADIDLQDGNDWESAIDCAQEFSNGRGIGKLEVNVLPS